MSTYIHSQLLGIFSQVKGLRNACIPDWLRNPESITGERAKEYMSSLVWPLNPNTLKTSMHQSIESIQVRYSGIR